MKLTRLSMIARNGIERLRAHGVEPDFDDVACLHDLGRKLERPEGSPALSVLGNPVKAGNVILWPWSIGAERWYNERAAPWFAMVPEFEILALVFSHVFSHDPEVLLKLVDRADAAAAIRKWAANCTASRAELTSALEGVLPEEKTPGKERHCPECGQYWPAKEDADREAELLPPSLSDPVFFDLIAILIKTFPGTSIEYWTWSTPQALTMRFLERHIRTEAGAGNLDPRSPQMLATHEFESAMRQIMAKHEARRKRDAVVTQGGQHGG